MEEEVNSKRDDDKPAPPSSAEEGEVVEENGRNGVAKEMSVSEYLKCEDMPVNGDGDADYDEPTTLQNR